MGIVLWFLQRENPKTKTKEQQDRTSSGSVCWCFFLTLLGVEVGVCDFYIILTKSK